MITVLTIGGVALAVFCSLVLVIRQSGVTRVDGCTIKLRGIREGHWLEYVEPSGRTFTFDAYWSRPKDAMATLEVEFPSELSITEGETPRTQEVIQGLTIPETPNEWRQIPTTQMDEIRDRVSRALTTLGVAHKFVRPMKSGWTSFEDGKEIYHG